MARRNTTGSVNRGARVAELVHQELATLIRSEVKDPGLGMITLNSVDLAPDYAYATIFYTVLPDDDASVAATQAALERAARFLRGQLGRRIRIHTTPELRFVLDRSTLRGLELDRLISEANRRQAQE